MSLRLSMSAVLLLFSCPKIDPMVTDGGLDAGSANGSYCSSVPTFVENLSACVNGVDDYRPRESNSSTDTWPACISDNNVFTPLNASIGTVARTQAYESIANRLWRNRAIPVPNDFIDSKVQYAIDQGIDSRVQRREDVHFPAAPMACSTVGIPVDFPERCVGPSTLLPILNDAFQKGAAGEKVLVQAARIEAALDWFFYVSALSEVMSCTQKAADCDSCWAYYSGGTARESPLGIGKEIFRVAPLTHHRAYDATLAVRCWRDVDSTATATNLIRRDLARAQLDKSLLRGMALLLREKIAELPCSTGQVLEARWAYVKIVGPLLDREVRVRNVAQADKLQGEFAKDEPAQVDSVGVISAIESVFSCP